MKHETIMILGGSPLQKDLLRNAKRRYNVVVVDGNPGCALSHESDEFVHLDFSDTERLHELALAKCPSMILTMASEPGNLAAAIVSARLGLRYNPVEVVYSTINKLKMKECLIAANIKTAEYMTAEAGEREIELKDGFSFPLVVKPSQSSAGRGVKLVNSSLDLRNAVVEAQTISADGRVLIEQFIAGHQFSVETISSEGKHHILGVTQEYFGLPPFFAETQQMFPANIDPVKESTIREFILNTLNAFKIRYGACHIELRIASNGDLYIIEIASRIGGWRSELISSAFGIEYTNLLLQSHECSPLLLKRSKNKFCIVKMIFGKVDLDRQQDLIRNPVYTVSPITWLKSSLTNSQSSLMDSAGYYFVQANNVKDALNAL